MGNQERLDKAIAARTGFSRREAHALVYRGLVTVNGGIAKDYSMKVSSRDSVSVDGTALAMAQYVYFMLNKPKGVVCATQDAVLPTVLDLVPASLRRSGLFPAGRLDKDTQGFVLITNDGELSHKLLSPKSHVAKTYLAQLDKPFPSELVQIFAAGVKLAPERAREGEKELCCMPAQLEPVEGSPCLARVILRQGMYHQVKRMFAANGLQVVALTREKIGGLALDAALEPGGCRPLTPQEVDMLQQEP